MGEHGVDGQQDSAGEPAGTDGAAHDGAVVLNAARADVEGDDDAEVERGDRVHRLVTDEKPLHRGVGRVRVRHRAVPARGPQGAAQKDDEDEQQQGGTEDLAKPVGELFRLEGEQERHTEEEGGVAELKESERCVRREEGGDGHFKGGAGGAGNGEAGPDGKIDEHRIDGCKARMYPSGQPGEPARPRHGDHPEDGEADGAEREPGHGGPGACPGLRAEKGREDQIPRPEEH